MRARQLTATPVDAGTYPNVRVPRYLDNGRYITTHEKGGWIELEWERNLARRHSPQVIVTEVRTIQVSKARAMQAMAELARSFESRQEN
jgi:hypothetical protein